jgi:ribosomal protein S18 acetylase RimI-like enzyme
MPFAADDPTVAAQPLPFEIRQYMEALFKTSFAEVTYEIGPQPTSIGARAFARGTNLYFSPDAFDPQSRQGVRLLAHELSHVVRQRSRRLLESFGPRAGIVYERSHEQEADWMGEQATRGWKPTRIDAPPGQTPAFRLCRPFEICQGSYQIAAGLRGQLAGSVMVHERSRSAVDITDLKVRPEFRKRGLGRILVQSALQTGLHLGRANAVLVSRDSGTSRLTRWYERLGFRKCGLHLGYPELAASISRALSGIACLTAPPLSGQLIQCMDDEQRRLNRLARFKTELDQQGLADEQKRADINHLRACVAALKAAILVERSIHVVAIGSAYKHHYSDPVQTFIHALENAAWTQIEGNLVGTAELVVTVRLHSGHTVTAGYKRYTDTATVFHCGETGSGVGYGTLLHY